MKRREQAESLIPNSKRRIASTSTKILVAVVFGAFLLGACGGAASGPTAAPATEASPDVEVGGPSFADLMYAGETDQASALDLYVPEGDDAPYPTVLIIRGQFDDKDRLHALGEAIASDGYAAAIVDYRYPSTTADVQSFRDAFCALGWLQAKGSEFDLDPDRVVLFGNAFGGWIASTLAASGDHSSFSGGCPHSITTGDSIVATIAFGGEFGVPSSCLSESWCLFHVSQAFGVPISDLMVQLEPLIESSPSEWGNLDLDAEAAAIAQTIPVALIDGSEPPFLILHGTKDFIPTTDSERFAEILEGAGVSVELQILESGSDTSIYDSDSGFNDLMQVISAYLAATFSP